MLTARIGNRRGQRSRPRKDCTPGHRHRQVMSTSSSSSDLAWQSTSGPPQALHPTPTPAPPVQRDLGLVVGVLLRTVGGSGQVDPKRAAHAARRGALEERGVWIPPREVRGKQVVNTVILKHLQRGSSRGSTRLVGTHRLALAWGRGRGCGTRQAAAHSGQTKQTAQTSIASWAHPN